MVITTEITSARDMKLGIVDPLPNNNCVKRRQYNSRCYGTTQWTRSPVNEGTSNNGKYVFCAVRAGSWGQRQFGNPEEEERPPLEAATKQRLGKTEKTLCVLWLQWYLECVTQRDCRSYFQSRVCPINPVTNSNLVSRHTQSRESIVINSYKPCTKCCSAVSNYKHGDDAEVWRLYLKYLK
jgi:hypothetical protein